jgi:hypothetical protein
MRRMADTPLGKRRAPDSNYFDTITIVLRIVGLLFWLQSLPLLDQAIRFLLEFAGKRD